MWLLNLALDHNAGILDHTQLIFSYLMLLGPFVVIYYTFAAISSYGSVSQVQLGTDWALTTETDSMYSVTFNSLLGLCIFDFVFEYMSLGPLAK